MGLAGMDLRRIKQYLDTGDWHVLTETAEAMSRAAGQADRRPREVGERR
jgi:hypothetical protein